MRLLFQHSGRVFGLFLLMGLLSAPAAAHQQGSSYSQWQLEDAATVQLRISELDLTRVSLHPQYTVDYHDEVLAYLQSHLRLWQHDVMCLPESGKVRVAEPGWLSVSWGFDCEQTVSEQWRIETHVLLAQAPGHLHFARLQQAENPVEQLLTSRDNQWSVDLTKAEVSTGFGNYLKLGVIHIWEGWDHLAFVLALLLLAGTWRQLAWLISGFTAGHSVTLVAATLGWLQPNMLLIEAVIAWSIALVAVEVLWQRAQSLYALWLIPILLLSAAWFGNAGMGLLLLGLGLFAVAYAAAMVFAQLPAQQTRLRALVTVSFGLIHGCGFAAVLAELSLPTSQTVSALLGFNLGVETGQLAVVLLLWPLLRWLTPRWPTLPVYLGLLLLGLAVTGGGCGWSRPRLVRSGLRETML